MSVWTIFCSKQLMLDACQSLKAKLLKIIKIKKLSCQDFYSMLWVCLFTFALRALLLLVSDCNCILCLLIFTICPQEWKLLCQNSLMTPQQAFISFLLYGQLISMMLFAATHNRVKSFGSGLRRCKNLSATV